MSDPHADPGTDADTDSRAGSGPSPDADTGSSKETTAPAQASSDATFEEGRYLYCAVALDAGGGAGETDATNEGDTETTSTDADAEFPTGIEDEPVHLVSIDDPSIGVLVHPCESLYDTDEMTRLHKWLLEHQQVVDAAGNRFGTPLPFRFDTVITGDDEQVREWIAEAAGTLSRYLDAFAGCWEYRIEVTTDESQLDAALEATDDRLAELGARIEESSSGTAFLLEKQYEQRLAELKRGRRAERSAALKERLADLAREVHSLEENTSSLIGEAREENPETRTQARLAVLADEDNEEAIGDVLDEVAAESGTTVKFTGPWPPYTFAPEIGAEQGGDG